MSEIEEVMENVDMENVAEEEKDLMEFETIKIHKRFAPLVDVIEKSSKEYADVLRKEMYLHSVRECSCYYANTSCLVGEFVEKQGSVYDMNKCIDRLAERNQLHRYSGFEIPVIEDTEENEGEFLFHVLGGAESHYLGIYTDIEKKYNFLRRYVSEENINTQQLYDDFCEEHNSLTPYSIACAIGLEESITFIEQ
jgi:hypothetical protein